MEPNREHFGRRLATLWVMVGTAVGLGNVWRFPYMMGSYGGGAFLLLYVFTLIIIGVPALAAEWTLGRATGKGPPGAYVAAGLPGGRVPGSLLFLTILMATSYYVVVIGWVVLYLLKAAAGGMAVSDSAALFEAIRANLPGQMGATWFVLAACGAVVAAGVRKGIARVSGIIVPVFFILLVGLVARSVTLPGAGEGLRYLVTFDPGAITGRTLLAVVGQAAFSLGLGGTFMVLYGAYLRPEARLFPLAVQTAAGDLFASLLAAALVVPAVFAAGLQPTSGPPLLFETLPVVFSTIPGGNLLAAVFFLALGLVAFLSAVAAVEAIVAPLATRAGWTRRRAIAVVVTAEALLAIPSMVSMDYLTSSDLIWGSTMQPVGSVVAIVAVAWSMKQGRALQTAGLSSDSRYGRLWIVWLRFVVPAAVLLSLISGWLGG